MENTNNLNLKKPDYTDFADIFDINDNMDTIDEKLHDTKDSVVAFTSSDVADGGASSWTNVTKVASGETHKSIFAKMSQMFKNVRYLYKLLGTTDISSIGDGTVTKALSVLNANNAAAPSEWDGEWTITYDPSLKQYRFLLMTAEYNGQVMTQQLYPSKMLAAKSVYLAYQDPAWNGRVKFTFNATLTSCTVSSFVNFSNVKLYGIW